MSGRRLFSGSRANRDRREASFDRWVIAEAERRRRASQVPVTDDALEAVEEARCQHCRRTDCPGGCPQECESNRRAGRGVQL